MENVNFLAAGGTTESIHESKPIDYGWSRHIGADCFLSFLLARCSFFQSSNVMHGRTKWIMGIVVCCVYELLWFLLLLLLLFYFISFHCAWRFLLLTSFGCLLQIKLSCLIQSQITYRFWFFFFSILVFLQHVIPSIVPICIGVGSFFFP